MGLLICLLPNARENKNVAQFGGGSSKVTLVVNVNNRLKECKNGSRKIYNSAIFQMRNSDGLA